MLWNENLKCVDCLAAVPRNTVAKFYERCTPCTKNWHERQQLENLVEEDLFWETLSIGMQYAGVLPFGFPTADNIRKESIGGSSSIEQNLKTWKQVIQATFTQKFSEQFLKNCITQYETASSEKDQT